jgi:hypothetical protein
MISARYTYDLGEARLVTAALFRTRDRYLDEFRSSGAFNRYLSTTFLIWQVPRRVPLEWRLQGIRARRGAV